MVLRYQSTFPLSPELLFKVTFRVPSFFPQFLYSLSQSKNLSPYPTPFFLRVICNKPFCKMWQLAHVFKKYLDRLPLANRAVYDQSTSAHRLSKGKYWVSSEHFNASGNSLLCGIFWLFLYFVWLSINILLLCEY